MLNANSQRELTSTEVTAIKECVKEYRAEIEAKFPNQLLREDVLDLLEDYCKVVYNGYIKFQNPTNKKYITDYPVLLEQAGRLGTIAQDKIDNIRKTFEMEKKETQRKMDDLID